jgi:predicted secreted protein
MKRFLPLFAITALSLGTALVQAAEPVAPPKKDHKLMRLTDADNQKTVAMAVGTAFDIALKGNATTGFQWRVDKIEGNAIRQVGKGDYVPDKHPEKMVGFGGTFIFNFDLTKAAKTTIRLVYVRPWEKDKPAEKTFEAVIDSTGAADDTLVFEGTVAKLEPSPLPDATQNYTITMQVTRVVKGRFKGKTFEFRIHSPTKAGLKLNEKYTVEAKRTKDGYTVDQDQWRKADSKRAARLTKDEVIAIAKAKATEEGIDLSAYDLKSVECVFEKKDRTWSVFFTRQPPVPGGHFYVSVDDKTKKTKLMRGE